MRQQPEGGHAQDGAELPAGTHAEGLCDLDLERLRREWMTARHRKVQVLGFCSVFSTERVRRFHGTRGSRRSGGSNGGGGDDSPVTRTNHGMATKCKTIVVPLDRSQVSRPNGSASTRWPIRPPGVTALWKPSVAGNASCALLAVTELRGRRSIARWEHANKQTRVGRTLRRSFGHELPN